MKKALAVFCSVLILLSALGSFVLLKVDSQKNKVVFTQENVEGDKEYAKGVDVELTMAYRSMILWKTSYKICDADESKTEFDFNKKYAYGGEELNTSFNVYTTESLTTTEGIDWIQRDDLTGIQKAYKELWNESEPGKSAKKLIRLKDYYEYYPFSIEMNINGYNINSISTLLDHDDNIGDGLTFKNKFESFFKIPVIENEYKEISIFKTAYDEYNQLGYGVSYDKGDVFDFCSLSGISDDTVYFSFGNKTLNGEKVDTSLIPGGYGIYAISFETKQTKDNAEYKLGEIENFFPLGDDCMVKNLCLNHDKTKIELVTEENSKDYLSIIDVKSRKLFQKLELPVGNVISWSNEKSAESFSVYRSFDNEDHLMFTVLSIDSEGKYNFEYIATREKVTDSYMSDFYYTDGMLYVANLIWFGERWDLGPSGFCVEVYMRDGLKYHGEYISSLMCGNSKNNGAYFVTNRSFPIKISVE